MLRAEIMPSASHDAYERCLLALPRYGDAAGARRCYYDGLYTPMRVYAAYYLRHEALIFAICCFDYAICFHY